MYYANFFMSCLDIFIVGLNVGMILANDIKTPMFWYILFFTGLFGFIGKLGLLRKGLLNNLPCNIYLYPI